MTITDTQHYSTSLKSPVGELTLVATDDGLRAVLWGPTAQSDREATLASATKQIVDWPDADDIKNSPRHAVLSSAKNQLREYFDHKRTSFDLPLDLRGTDFQVEAWRALNEIPFGTTASYKDQAVRLGRPKAVRAVGNANKRNPVPIVLPCHRVTQSGGTLGGYGGAGGVATKAALLDLEGATYKAS